MTMHISFVHCFYSVVVLSNYVLGCQLWFIIWKLKHSWCVAVFVAPCEDLVVDAIALPNTNTLGKYVQCNFELNSSKAWSQQCNIIISVPRLFISAAAYTLIWLSESCAVRSSCFRKFGLHVDEWAYFFHGFGKFQLYVDEPNSRCDPYLGFKRHWTH